MRKTENPTLRAAPPSGAGVMASFSGHADTHPLQAVRKASAPLPVDQQAPKGRAGVLPEVFHNPQLTVVRTKAAAKKHKTFTLTVTEEQRRDLSYVLLCWNEDLAQSYEAHEPEVQQVLRNLRAVQQKLQQGVCT